MAGTGIFNDVWGYCMISATYFHEKSKTPLLNPLAQSVVINYKVGPLPVISRGIFHSTYRSEITPVKSIYKAIYRGYNSIYNWQGPTLYVLIYHKRSRPNILDIDPIRKDSRSFQCHQCHPQSSWLVNQPPPNVPPQK